MDQETRIFQCPQCGAKNRIPVEKFGFAARCGKCKAEIDTEKLKNREKTKENKQGPQKPSPGPKESYKVRCTSCGAKNRIPGNKMGLTAKCGKCQKSIETAGLLSGRSVMVTDRDFENKVIKSPLPVLFFCFANWCPSCQTVIPVVEQLAREWKGRVKVTKLNVDQNQMTANRFNIMSVPTILIFDNGQLKDRLTGAMPKTQIMQRMAPFL